ncbi:DNA damage-regulated autophagy modulator protein 1 [Pleurodeles waltl]
MLGLPEGLAYIPSLLVIWSAAAFIISYVTAVSLGHVEPLVPYISDTGTTPPESAIFGFMISITSFLGTFTMYARYKIVQKQNEVATFIPHWFNMMSLVFGVLGCIGMVIVATFQERSVPIVHDVGALLTFICGVFYILLQSMISLKSSPHWSSTRLCRIRMAISIVSLAALIPMIICASLIFFSHREWETGKKITRAHCKHHCLSDLHYRIHLASAICEWIVAFGFVSYFLTYVQEFQQAKLKIITELNGGYR